jgi:hypothetical protein
MLGRLDQYIEGESSMTEEELADMERAVSRLKIQYGLR